MYLRSLRGIKIRLLPIVKKLNEHWLLGITVWFVIVKKRKMLNSKR
jgi:hypothetical protein